MTWPLAVAAAAETALYASKPARPAMAQPSGPAPSRTQTIARTAAVMWLVACGTSYPPPPSSPQPPNIVIILSDALRASNMDVYGYPRSTTPFLSEMAEESAVFDHAFAHYPGTPMSVSQLMTGRYLPPTLMHTQVFGVATRALPDDHPVLPRLLSQAGYRTGMVTSHYWFQDGGRLVELMDNAHIVESDEPYAPFPELLEPVRAFLDEDRDEPFFLYVHSMDTHGPSEVHAGDEDLRVAGLAEQVAAYDSEIRRTDQGVKRIVEMLEERGLLDHTIVVFTSDHGEEFGEVSDAHYDRDHGLQLRRPLVEVPLIVRLPQGKGAGRYDAPVGLVDLLPTLLHLADPSISRPDGDGVDLAPRLLAGTDDPKERTVLAHSYRYWALYDQERELLLDQWADTAQLFALKRDAHNYPRQQPLSSEHAADWESSLRTQRKDLLAGFAALPQNTELSGEVQLPLPHQLSEGSAAPVFAYEEDDNRWTFAGRELLAFPTESVDPMIYEVPFVDGRWRIQLTAARGGFNEGTTVSIEGGKALVLGSPEGKVYDLGDHDITDPLRLQIQAGKQGVSLQQLTLTRQDKPGAPPNEALEQRLRALGYGQ